MPFFGQKSAMILDSGDWAKPYIFLRFLKKKPTNTWEKPSQGEGKALKINLLEIVAMLKVCTNKTPKWQTVHKSQKGSTSISIERQNEDIVFMISGYAKPLKGPEVDIFTDLLAHIYSEKIANATGPSKEKDPRPSAPPSINTSFLEDAETDFTQFDRDEPANSITDDSITADSPSDEHFENPFEEPNAPQAEDSAIISPEKWFDSLQTQGDYCLVPGQIITKSAKAISFQINNKPPFWVPLSCVNSALVANNGMWIKTWFMGKKMPELFC